MKEPLAMEGLEVKKENDCCDTSVFQTVELARSYLEIMAKREEPESRQARRVCVIVSKRCASGEGH